MHSTVAEDTLPKITQWKGACLDLTFSFFGLHNDLGEGLNHMLYHHNDLNSFKSLAPGFIFCFGEGRVLSQFSGKLPGQPIKCVAQESASFKSMD